MRISFYKQVNINYKSLTNKSEYHYKKPACMSCDTFSFTSNQKIQKSSAKISRFEFEKAKKEQMLKHQMAQEISKKYGIEIKEAVGLIDKSGYVLAFFCKIYKKRFSKGIIKEN